MRHTLLWLFCFWGFNLYSQNVVNSIWGNEIDSIVGGYVDIDIMTPVSVPCYKFTEFFKAFSSFTISDKKQIGYLKQVFSLLEPIEDEYIDVRVKLLVYIGDKIIPVCIGENTVYFDNKYYKTTKEFNKRFFLYIKRVDKLQKESIALDIEKPLLQGSDSNLADAVKFYLSCMPFKVKETSRILVDFNIDQNGNAVDVLLRNRDNRNKVDSLLMKSNVGIYIIDIFSNQLKWTSSDYRMPKVNIVLPVTLLGDSENKIF